MGRFSRRERRGNSPSLALISSRIAGTVYFLPALRVAETSLFLFARLNGWRHHIALVCQAAHFAKADWMGSRPRCQALGTSPSPWPLTWLAATRAKINPFSQWSRGIASAPHQRHCKTRDQTTRSGNKGESSPPVHDRIPPSRAYAHSAKIEANTAVGWSSRTCRFPHIDLAFLLGRGNTGD